MKTKICESCGTEFTSDNTRCDSCRKKTVLIRKTIPRFILILSIISLAIYIFLLNNGYLSTSSSYSNSTQKSMEYMLAVIDNDYLNSDDPIIKRYKYLLTSIDNKTKENYTQIGNMTVKAQTQLEDRYGVQVTLITILEDLNYTIPDNLESSYAEMSALYIMIKGK